MKQKIKEFFRKIIGIDDSPHKVAAGFGLGIFLGILPGTGPVASLFMAWLLKVNRASAVLGSLLVNTWLSIVTFLLAIKIGSLLMGLNWQDVYEQYAILLKDFHLSDLLKVSFLSVITPLVLGYLIISAVAGLFAYGIMFAVIKFFKS